MFISVSNYSYFILESGLQMSGTLEATPHQPLIYTTLTNKQYSRNELILYIDLCGLNCIYRLYIKFD